MQLHNVNSQIFPGKGELSNILNSIKLWTHSSLFPDSTITWNCYLMFLTQSPTGRLACSSLAQGWPSSTSSRNLFPTNQLFQVSHRQLSRKSILLLGCYSIQVPSDLRHWVTLPFPTSHYWDHQQQQSCADSPPWGAPRDWGSIKSHWNRTAELKTANQFWCS